MAEVLGSVAAAFQLAETALKLKKLYSQIKNAPQDLSELVDEVSVLADILTDLQDNHVAQRQTLAEDKAWQKCYRLFQSCTDSMRKVTSHLESILQAHKHSGSVRVYLKRDGLVRCRDRLERAKSSMIIAQQSYSSTLLMQQCGVLLKEVRGIAMDQQKTAQAALQITTTPNAQASDRLAASACHSKLLTYADAGQNSADTMTKKPKKTYVQNFYLPKWLLRTGLQVLIDRSNGSLGITFQVFNHVSSKSAVFIHANRGEWDRVWYLFETRQASPFNIDEYGHTLLAPAVKSLNYSACQKLLGYGLRPSQESGHTNVNFCLMFPCLAYAEIPKYMVGDFMNLISLLGISNDGCIMEEEMHDISYYLGNFPLEVVIALKSMAFPSWEGLDPWYRASAALLSCSCDYRVYRALLGDDQTFLEALQLSYDCGSWGYPRECTRIVREMPARIAEVLSYWYTNEDTNSEQIKGWQGILALVISLGSRRTGDMEFTSSIGRYLGLTSDFKFNEMEILENLTYTTIDELHHQLNARFRMWVGVVRDMGGNLNMYGRAEKKYLSLTEQHPFGWKKVRQVGIAIKYITFGSEVEDWNLYVIPVIYYNPPDNAHSERVYGYGYDLYSCAGDFWNWVENPELFNVPGSFHEDEDWNEYVWYRDDYCIIEGPCF